MCKSGLEAEAEAGVNASKWNIYDKLVGRCYFSGIYLPLVVVKCHLYCMLAVGVAGRLDNCVNV